MENKLFLFDFDGTITQEDSFVRFILYTQPKWRIAIALVRFSVQIIGYKLKLLNGEKLKVQLLSFFFKGLSRKALENLGQSFIQDLLLRNNFQVENFDQFKHFVVKGKVVIVSASIDIWMKPFAAKFDCDYLCTSLAYDQNETFQGKLHTANCIGQEKVNRIKKHLNLSDYQEIHVFGDSVGDKEMMQLATHKHWLNRAYN